jgi:hypothetical protein
MKPTAKKSAKKPAGRPKGEAWSAEVTQFDYTAGQVGMMLRFHANARKKGMWIPIVTLNNLFEVAVDSEKPELKRVFITKALHRRLEKLIASAKPNDEEEEIAMILNRSIIAFTAQAYNIYRPSAAQTIMPISHSPKVHDVNALDGWEHWQGLSKELLAKFAAIRADILHGTSASKSTAQRRMQKIFRCAGEYWSGGPTAASPKKGSLTCKYVGAEGEPPYDVLIEVAAIEGAFVLTSENVQSGHERLPTKADLWTWMRQRVMGGVPLLAERENDIMKRAGLSGLPMKQRVKKEKQG